QAEDDASAPETERADERASDAQPQADSIAAAPREKSETEIDLASLPPIESIVAGTDITAFLRAGIPAELTRAALRRAWAADPAIRDFVGLSENSWDFTAPGGVPGFGPLSAEDSSRLLSQFSGQLKEAVQQIKAIDPAQTARVSVPAE